MLTNCIQPLIGPDEFLSEVNPHEICIVRMSRLNKQLSAPTVSLHRSVSSEPQALLMCTWPLLLVSFLLAEEVSVSLALEVLVEMSLHNYVSVRSHIQLHFLYFRREGGRKSVLCQSPA